MTPKETVKIDRELILKLAQDCDYHPVAEVLVALGILMVYAYKTENMTLENLVETITEIWKQSTPRVK